MAGRPAVGLDIGTSGVRAAELKHGKRGATLEKFGQVALPLGAVQNGEVVDPAAVSAALKTLWSEVRFSTKKVAVGVANQKVIVRQVDLPSMPLPELRKSLAFQVQDYIPMPVEQAILDFHVLEEATDASGARVLRVLLVAAARTMVESTLTAVTGAGLQPVQIDLTGFAVLRSLLVGDGLAAVHAEALVDVGSSVTNIVVHQGGVPRFVRILLMGGGDITDAVAERLGVPLEEAEAVKQAAGLGAEPGASDGPASRAIATAGSALVDEVRGSLDYFVAQSDTTRISRVLLSGGGSQLVGLPERLAAATRLPVELARPLSTLRVGKTGLTEDQLAEVEPLATVPVGLALAGAA